jgi:hypothetical protein
VGWVGVVWRRVCGRRVRSGTKIRLSSPNFLYGWSQIRSSRGGVGRTWKNQNSGREGLFFEKNQNMWAYTTGGLFCFIFPK